jgi:hypothetical protein
MTTNATYNPILSALRELTTQEAFRWYSTQAKATAALAHTIALRSIAIVQPLLKPTSAMPKKTEAMQVVEAIAQPEPIPTLASDVDAEAQTDVFAENDIPTLLRVSGGDAEDERPDSVDEQEDTSFYGAEDELEDAIAQNETDKEPMQVPAGWNAIEADDDADSGLDCSQKAF